MMRALVTRGVGETSLQMRPQPRAGNGEVVLQPLYVGMCGSDASIFKGAHPYLSYPIVQGHEVVARVLEVGGGTDQELVGLTVVVEPTLPCGECPACRGGITNACLNLEVIGVHRDGGLADFLVVPVGAIHPATDISARAGVFVEPMAVALWAVQRGGVREGEKVVVLGAGAIGRCVLLALRSAGATVCVVDRSTVRRGMAEELGALSTEDFGDVESQLRTWGATAAIDTTGSAEIIQQAIAGVTPGGRVVVVGISPDDLAVPVAALTRREVSIVGARNSVGMFPRALDIVREHQEALERTIEREIPLQQAMLAMRAVAERTVEGKVVVTVGGG